MNEQLVEVKGVIKRYGATVAVDDVSLAIRAGEIYALVGANGAGKSTLIRSVVGITVPDKGEVIVCGEDMRHHAARAKRKIGYLPEELILYERLTGEEYLHLVAGLKEADEQQIPEALDFFELKEVAGKWTGGYSLGMRKKLGLAAAMLGSAARVLVLDEPLNGLDVEMMRKLRQRIDAESARGRAILVTSHVMSFVERISDRIGIMRGGKLIAEGTAQELRARTNLSDAPFEDVFFKLAK